MRHAFASVEELNLKYLQSLAVRRANIDTAIVPLDQVRRGDGSHSTSGSSRGGYSLVATRAVGAFHIPKVDKKIETVAGSTHFIPMEMPDLVRDEIIARIEG